MKRLLYIIAAIFLAVSCSEDESWTTSPSDLLSFSVDTVRFDTLISTIPSATKHLIIYNRGKKGIRISGVWLSQGVASPFRTNVDGVTIGSSADMDFEVRGKDSLVVRIEVTPPQTGQAAPKEFADDLLFRLESGVIQKVRLTVGSQDAYIHQGLIVTADTTFSTAQPVVIYDSLVVAEGATLTLAAGTRLLFHDGAGLEVRGRLLALGTTDSLVTMRSDRTDHMFDYLLYDATPSRWKGLHIHSGSVGNVLRHCDIHSGCYGIKVDSTDISVESLLIENSVIHNVGGNGLQLESCGVQILNSQISNAKGHCVYLYGGDYLFLHCTIAQFYPFEGGRGDALRIENTENGVYRHLERAYFVNCVITGYGEDVIMGDIEEGQDYTCDYLFSNCFLNTVVSDDTIRFRHIVYDNDKQTLVRDKNFARFDTHNFVYDFTPDSASAIRNMGDTAFISIVPTDRLGRSRTLDDGPDAGCYEYVKP